MPTLLPLMALLSGVILALTAGQYAVGLLMQTHSARLRQRGLKNGGRQIGLLERGLVFLFLSLLGQTGCGGFPDRGQINPAFWHGIARSGQRPNM